MFSPRLSGDKKYFACQLDMSPGFVGHMPETLRHVPQLLWAWARGLWAKCPKISDTCHNFCDNEPEVINLIISGYPQSRSLFFLEW